MFDDFVNQCWGLVCACFVCDHFVYNIDVCVELKCDFEWCFVLLVSGVDGCACLQQDSYLFDGDAVFVR